MMMRLVQAADSRQDMEVCWEAERRRVLLQLRHCREHRGADAVQTKVSPAQSMSSGPHVQSQPSGLSQVVIVCRCLEVGEVVMGRAVVVEYE